VAQVLGGGFWAKAMALSIALSVIATTGTGIVLGARIVYGMANHRVLPEFLGTVSRRYATPVASSVVVGLLIVILSAVYYLVTSVQNAFFDVIDVTGLLFSIFYILTALAAVAYYRGRIASGVVDFVTVGLLPLGAAGFLGWIFVKSLGEAPWSQRWSLIGIVIAGLVVVFPRGSSCAPRSSRSPGRVKHESRRVLRVGRRPGGEGAAARRRAPGPLARVCRPRRTPHDRALRQRPGGRRDGHLHHPRRGRGVRPR
jgi:amino acid transporter